MAEQLCVLCDKLFEIDDSFKVIRPMMRGRMLVLDKDGVCHELLSVKKTGQRHRTIQKKEQIYIVQQIEKVPVAAPVSVVETPRPAVITEVDDPPSGSTHHAVLDEDPFSPQPHEWYDALVVVVNERGFAVGLLGGDAESKRNLKVFIHQKIVRRASGLNYDTEAKVGSWLAVQIIPSTREGSTIPFECIDAVIEDIPELQEGD
jgi:hypothetical protein